MKDPAKAAAKYFDASEEQAAEHFRTPDGYDRGSDTLHPVDGIGSLMSAVITDIYVQDGYTCLEYLIQFPGQWEGEKIEIDLSDPDFDEKKYNFTKEDFCILTVSVLEGRIPSPAAAKLKKLQGSGAKVLLVAVFSNRAVDDCLPEMRDVMTEAEFVPAAAIVASVQHSIINNA